MHSEENVLIWNNTLALESVAGVYVHGSLLWIHDGQWKGELLDLGSGARIRQLTLCPSWDLLRQILSEEALRWRLQAEPIVIEDDLLVSITNGAVSHETGEFGLMLVRDWQSAAPRFEPLHYDSIRQSQPFACGVQQGAFDTPKGKIGLLSAQLLYDMTKNDSGPYAFSFFEVDLGSGVFSLVSEVTHQGANMGMAYRNLVIPHGWQPRAHAQPTCFDWAREKSVWTFEGTIFEVTSRDEGGFTISARRRASLQ
jgi:hypothetical protein